MKRPNSNTYQLWTLTTIIIILHLLAIEGQIWDKSKPNVDNFSIFSKKHDLAVDLRQPPHIVFVLIDDMGFNDVGFHGSRNARTPNIDKLAHAGIILENYYGQPVCSPSRAALLTGRYPFRIGLQHFIIPPDAPFGLGLDQKLLPEYLKSYGYATHMIGKWHLGSYLRKYTPINRGFDTYLGYLNGHQDYYERLLINERYGRPGYDFYNNLNLAVNESRGQYVTDLFTDRAVEIIAKHDARHPMFLYVAHNAIHSGEPKDPLQATPERLAQFAHVQHEGRRIVLARTLAADDSVAAIFSALQARGFDRNTIFIFSSDNGGPPNGSNLNYANNWPLRGGKQTLYEGGIRLPGFIWSPRLKTSGYRSKHMMHLIDWLPTLVGQASSNSRSKPDLSELDGVDMWQALSTNAAESPRYEIVHQYDQTYNWGAFRHNQWKLIVNEGAQFNKGLDGYYPPESEPNPQTTENCHKTVNLFNYTECRSQEAPCLYDIENDPCEHQNLASVYPKLVRRLLNRFDAFKALAVEPRTKPFDPCSNPLLFNGTWTWWLEFTGGEAYENFLPRYHSNEERRAAFMDRIPPKTCDRPVRW